MIYVAPSAVLVGDVTVEDAASIWHGAVLRGDFDSIIVARDSNIQDNAVVHVDRGFPADTLLAGVPARPIRTVDETLRRRIELSWSIYRELAKATLPTRPAIQGDLSKQVSLDLSDDFTRLLREE